MTKSKQQKRGKITATEHERRVDETRDLLAGGHPKSEIKRVLADRYQASPRTAERYIAAARVELLLLIREERTFQRACSLSVYTSVIRDPAASHRDRIRAQQAIDRLLGLCDPIKVAQTDTHGNDLTPDQARAAISSLWETVKLRLESQGIDPDADTDDFDGDCELLSVHTEDDE